jgi:predicted TIM-barrel fold metal-dependent hydrolase
VRIRCSARRCAGSSQGAGGHRFLRRGVCYKAFVRFPALRFASVENGASWVPDLLHRLDDAANRNPGYFTNPPRETFGEHVWVTPFWEDHIDELVTHMRTDRLLLGSDWPHAEGTRQPAEFISESLAGISEAGCAADRAAERAGCAEVAAR